MIRRRWRLRSRAMLRTPGNERSTGRRLVPAPSPGLALTPWSGPTRQSTIACWIDVEIAHLLDALPERCAAGPRYLRRNPVAPPPCERLRAIRRGRTDSMVPVIASGIWPLRCVRADATPGNPSWHRGSASALSASAEDRHDGRALPACRSVLGIHAK